MHQEVRLTNLSHRPCTLSGGPTAVTGVAVAGGTTRLTSVAMGDGFNLIGPGPANLRPGQAGWVTLSFGDGCPALTSGGKANYRTLFIVLDSGPVRVDFPTALNLICGPSYTEYLHVSSGPGSSPYLARHYYLNCAAIRQIPARESVTFVMRMPVPPSAGQAKFGWQLQGTDVATARIITIRHRPQ